MIATLNAKLGPEQVECLEIVRLTLLDIMREMDEREAARNAPEASR